MNKYEVDEEREWSEWNFLPAANSGRWLNSLAYFDDLAYSQCFYRSCLATDAFESYLHVDDELYTEIVITII
ncbi:uncharacterized protein Z519_00255 [Cladophialophora bantiana CBS 173.52]|uniref:Uncharacterized protein n=1 Tax=Cladophialophora bantiana (strain ATCC 10958 / CBS 173.52 / CDC B-1940 / NIH 8579) TaxID=1442370 RepID=A0A0D2IPB2_CLAB1|nr:uncharacterized protein Z519_00255 [Cladophialophora bantiana CBS 173.52]KIW98594.1 hypothetical protein Z519_00255 [Cladophialophora bantiana CBS 173.52]